MTEKFAPPGIPKRGIDKSLQQQLANPDSTKVAVKPATVDSAGKKKEIEKKRSHLFNEKKQEMLNIQQERIDRIKRDASVGAKTILHDYILLPNQLKMVDLEPKDRADLLEIRHKINSSISKIFHDTKNTLAASPASPGQPEQTPEPIPASPIQPEPIIPAVPAQPEPTPEPTPASPMQPESTPELIPAAPAQPEPIPEPTSPASPIQPEPIIPATPGQSEPAPTTSNAEGRSLIEERRIAREARQEITKKKESNKDKAALELEIARKEFAEMDHEKQSKWDTVMSFFGKKRNREKNSDLLKQAAQESDPVKKALLQKQFMEAENDNKDHKFKDEDVAYMEAQYLNKLMDYKNARLKDLDEKGLKGEALEKEMMEVAKYVTVVERAQLLDSQMDVKKEKKMKTWGGKIESCWIKSVSAYKDLSKNQKRLLSLGLVVGAAGAAMTGAPLAAAAFLGGRTLIRFLSASGVAYGVSVADKASIEKKMEKKRGEEMEKENTELLESTENLSEKERMNKVKQLLDGKLFQANDEFQKMKVKDSRMNAQSVSIGILAGAGSFYLGKILEATGISGGLHNLFDKIGIPGFLHDIFGQPDVPEPSVAPSIENGKDILMEVKDGSSFEGTLIKHVEEYKDVLVAKHPEFANVSNGQIAHRLAIDFMHKHPEMEGHLPSLVHAGAQLKFNPETLEMEIKDPQGYSWLKTHVHKEMPSVIPPVEATTGVPASVPPVEIISGTPATAANPQEVAEKVFEQHKKEEILATQHNVADAQARYVDANQGYSQAADNALHASEPTNEQFEKMGLYDKARIAETDYIKEVIQYPKTVGFETSSVQFDLCSGDKRAWIDMKGLTWSQAYSEEKYRPFLEATKRKMEATVGKYSLTSWDENETIEEWSKRAARKYVDEKMKDPEWTDKVVEKLARQKS